MRYIVIMSGPTVGMDAYDVALCEPDEIAEIAEQMCIDHIGSYGYDYDPNGEDDYESVTSELDYTWEEYDPEKHDQHRFGGGSFADEFERMEQGR